jgi:hypothetical protein
MSTTGFVDLWELVDILDVSHLWFFAITVGEKAEKS